MPLDLDDLTSDSPGLGKPRMLPVDSIEEDPSQPRSEFDAEALRELAQTIAARGVQQPVSVRPIPGVRQRWMLNFGARRLRASKIAGKTEIPAFIDELFDSYDQVIENGQREALKPLELAPFVQRRLAAGDNQSEIAGRLGKSKSFITIVSSLIDAPDWLLAAYRSGQCRGLTELYELRRLHQVKPDAVDAVLANGGPVTRHILAEVKAGGAGHAVAKATRAANHVAAETTAGMGSFVQEGLLRTPSPETHAAEGLFSQAARHCDALEVLFERIAATDATESSASWAAIRSRLLALAAR